jgi:hypothetical protein
MNSQILSEMRLKTTEELLEIWRENDPTQWSEDAFEVVKGLLLERVRELPEQKAPVVVDKASDVQESANKLLENYRKKKFWAILLEFPWIFCLFTAGILLVGAMVWMVTLLTNTIFSVVHLEEGIIITAFLFPLYFLRERAKNSASEAKKKLVELIAKGLEQ